MTVSFSFGRTCGFAAAGLMLLCAASLALAQDEMTEEDEAVEIPLPTFEAVEQPSGVPVNTVVMQGLDKITARISTFDAPIDQPVVFGSLQIIARTCHKTPPEEPPERAAFIEIDDVQPDRPETRLFTGWMFASSPALSSLEHPVYDVWVIDCVARAPQEPAAAEGATMPAEPDGESEPPATAQ